MSSINVFATQEDITKVEDKITSVSDVNNIVINLTKSSVNNEYKDFIKTHRLDDLMYTVDLGNLVEASSTKYYTSFDTALLDVNNNTTEHSTTTSEGAVCKLCINGNIKVIQLLANCTHAANNFNVPIFVDLNGFELTNTMMISTSNEFLCLYGVKSNSKYIQNSFSGFVNAKTCYLIGFEYELVYTGATIFGVCVMGTNDTLVMKGIKLNYTDTSTDKSIAFIGSYDDSTIGGTCIIDSCDIYMKYSSQSFFGGIFFPSNDPDKTFNLVHLNNSKLKLVDVKDKGDDTVCAISQGKIDYLVINNCEICGTNNGVQSTAKNIFINNSILRGTQHGGIYIYNGCPTYAKNSEFYLDNEPYVQTPNYYSCYIGYNGDGYFDNCKFTSFNNQYNRPALKTGDYSTYVYRNTQAHFSNCEMTSIRVDQYCRAYMGLGMSDQLKQQSVSGEIVDAGDVSYNYNLHINQVDEDKYFYCTYGTTTYAEIQAAVNAGKIPVCVYNQGSYTGGVYNFFGMTSSTCTFTKMYSTTSYYAQVNTSNTWSNSSTGMEAPYQSKYNNRRTVGANQLGRTLICAEDKDGRITPMVLGNTTAATKTACTVPFRPKSIYYYNSTSTLSAGALMNTATLFECVYTTACAYTFNGSMPYYSTAYLIGTYDKTTGLFTLDSTSTTSYYVFVPNNTASITLSSYFTEGKYYIRIGSSTASANQLQIEMHKPMYYFDGTNLVDGYTAGGVTDVRINGTSITQDGVANIPSDVANAYAIGKYNNNYGIDFRANHSCYLRVVPASTANIDARTNVLTTDGVTTNRAIVPNNLVYAVDSVLCSTSASEALTSQQKANAKARLGISDSEKFELIEEVSIVSGITEIDKYTEPDGTAYNFKAVRVYLDGVTPDSTEYNRIMYMRLFNGDNDIVGGAYHDIWNTRQYGILDVYDKRGFWESEFHTSSSATAWNNNYALPTLNMRMMEVNNNYIKHINFKAATDGSSFASGTIKIYAIRA